MLELKINSPANVIPGQTYEVRLTIKNQSKKAGTLVPATLTVGIAASTQLVTLIPAQKAPYSFEAGESRTLSYVMNVPSNASGSGSITALVEDPLGNALASASENVVIVAPIVYLKLKNIPAYFQWDGQPRIESWGGFLESADRIFTSSSFGPVSLDATMPLELPMTPGGGLLGSGRFVVFLYFYAPYWGWESWPKHSQLISFECGATYVFDCATDTVTKV